MMKFSFWTLLATTPLLSAMAGADEITDAKTVAALEKIGTWDGVTQTAELQGPYEPLVLVVHEIV